MARVCDFSGFDYFSNSKESSQVLSLGGHVDVYFPSRKRSRITAPFVVMGEPKRQPSIEVLPDECLFEVFRRLPGGQERSVCAAVSKRWLMLLSSIKKEEICDTKATQFAESEIKSNLQKADECAKSKEKGNLDGIKTEDEDLEETDSCGYLSRCLEGKKATDVRLAAIAVGTASCGGLVKLSIRGSVATRGLTNFGIKAISSGCPSLKALSLWNLASVGDEGLFEIASGCRSLEKLDLSHCPAISDKSLVAIAMNCTNLMSITIDSCLNIGNDSLQALGRYCRNLRCVTVKNCPRVSDQGIASLLSSAGDVLTKAKFQALQISDVSLAVIGHYGKVMTDLALVSLKNVNERGLWVMGKGQGLKKLKSLSIIACGGVSDLGLEALGKGCPDLSRFNLKKCPLISDAGVVSFSKAAGSLENLQLDECHRITQCGVFGVLANCSGKLKAFAASNCLGLRDLNIEFPLTSLCDSLRSLTISNCPGFGDAGMGTLAQLCPRLTHIDLSGLQTITDAGVLPLVQSTEAGLKKVNLSGCVNLSDNAVTVIAKLHGETLELLNLDGCRYVTDASLVAVTGNCSLLSELDVTCSRITDSGIAALAATVHLNLRVLSVADCTLVSDQSLPYFGVLAKNLMGLNIQNCRGMSSGAVDLLLEQHWRCDILT